MIYLIQSAYIDEDDNFHKALKIGYAKDLDKRLIAYHTHSPNIKLLDSREGDEELEKHLHLYFSKYRLSNYEWFEYNEEIINNFSSITLSTILPVESIKYEPKVDKTSFINRKSKKDLEIIKIFQDLYSIFQTTNSDINKIIKEKLEKIDLRLYLKKSVNSWKEFYNTFIVIVKDKVEEIRKEQEIVKSLSLNYFSSYIYFIPNFDYDLISEDEFIERLGKLDKVCYSDMDILFDKFYDEFIKDGSFPRKMKLYCEFVDTYLSGDYNYMKNTKIPKTFHLYYSMIGSQKIKSVSYQESLLKNIINNNEKKNPKGPLVEEIDNAFSVGDKIPLQKIKETLLDIYQRVGINSKAKATDIQTFFEVKDISFKEKGTGKRIKGYILLSKKVIYI